MCMDEDAKNSTTFMALTKHVHQTLERNFSVVDLCARIGEGGNLVQLSHIIYITFTTLYVAQSLSFYSFFFR